MLSSERGGMLRYQIEVLKSENSKHLYQIVTIERKKLYFSWSVLT